MLDRAKGAAPLYSQLENIMREKIENGEYVTGDVFLSEKQMQEQYAVSRVTVRQAVNNLVNAGYLECSRGIGTIVTLDKINENIRKVISFSEEMKQHGIIMHTSFCEICCEPSSYTVATQLGLEVGASCYKLVRVRCAEDRPVVYSFTYLPATVDLPMEDRYYRESLYALLGQHNILVARGKDTLEAVIANQEVSEMLDIEVGAPVFKRTRKTYDQFDKTIEFAICYYPGDRYKYTIDL